jgi:hypothetical protein
LIKNVDAVLVFFDEALEAANLTFDTPQSLLDGGLFIDVTRQCHATPFVFEQYTPWWYTINTGDCLGRSWPMSSFAESCARDRVNSRCCRTLEPGGGVSNKYLART